MIASILLYGALQGCENWFGEGDSTDTGPPDTGAGAGDTGDSGSALAEDDARVRALTDLTEGTWPCREPLLGRVSHITDGDTVYVRPDDGSADLKVRLIGVDSPEIEHDDPAECFGPEAMAHTAAALSGHLVWLTFDSGCTDQYGRSLAYVIRGEGEAGFYNRELLQQGFATTLSIEPNTTFESTFEADLHDAQDHGMGMWESCE